ncbi:MAG: hypothetical protein WD670_07430 [Actinomycetota bacterium]
MDTLTGPELLSAGRGFVDVSRWRSVAVSGSEATDWLNDLVTADLVDIRSAVARRSLLLSPTGSVLAEFTVAVVEGTVVLIQDPRQPRSIATLLEPYVLSSGVELEDRTGRYAVFAFPGLSVAPDAPGATWSAPSCLGAGGDLIAPGEVHDRLASLLSGTYVQALDEDAESWRIASAIPRIGFDTSDGDLPQEVRLDHAVSFDKGCFLGQEAVAKMRNLGHPRHWVAALEGDGAVSAGDRVSAGDEESGVVTSVTSVNGASLALARIRWEDREAILRTTGGVELRPRIPV